MCRECGCEETYHADDCSCDCERHHHRHKHFRTRQFFTKEEKIKKLEGYAEDLKKELTAVQEQIEELKGK